MPGDVCTIKRSKTRVRAKSTKKGTHFLSNSFLGELELKWALEGE